MAAALIDRADEFDGEREEWPHYVERLKFRFKATLNGSELYLSHWWAQRPTSSCGSQTRRRLQNW